MVVVFSQNGLCVSGIPPGKGTVYGMEGEVILRCEEKWGAMGLIRFEAMELLVMMSDDSARDGWVSMQDGGCR